MEVDNAVYDDEDLEEEHEWHDIVPGGLVRRTVTSPDDAHLLDRWRQELATEVAPHLYQRTMLVFNRTFLESHHVGVFHRDGDTDHVHLWSEFPILAEIAAVAHVHMPEQPPPNLVVVHYFASGEARVGAHHEDLGVDDHGWAMMLVLGQPRPMVFHDPQNPRVRHRLMATNGDWFQLGPGGRRVAVPKTVWVRYPHWQLWFRHVAPELDLAQVLQLVRQKHRNTRND